MYGGFIGWEDTARKIFEKVLREVQGIIGRGREYINRKCACRCMWRHTWLIL